MDTLQNVLPEAKTLTKENVDSLRNDVAAVLVMMAGDVDAALLLVGRALITASPIDNDPLASDKRFEFVVAAPVEEEVSKPAELHMHYAMTPIPGLSNSLWCAPADWPNLELVECPSTRFFAADFFCLAYNEKCASSNLAVDQDLQELQ